ncbi:MAG: PAS domain S-box protein [Candidatus Accumulibacter sp.]|nr:PAS domain S-box protein [Accumulibacter sp.]
MLPERAARPRGWQPGRHFSRHLVVGIVCINLLAATALAFLLDESRRSEEQKFRIRAASIVGLVSRDIESQYARIDLSLRVIAEESANQLAIGGRHFERWMERVRQRHPAVSFMRISDAAGNIVYSPDDELAPRTNIADRDYFARLRADPRAGLQITPPLLGRTTGTPLIVLARRLEPADGHFSGVVLASIPIARLQDMLASLLPGADSYVGLIDAQYQWVAAQPATAGKQPFLAALREALARSPERGVFLGNGDAGEQLVAYARSEAFGFYAVVGQPAGVVFADWRKTAVVGAVGMALFALLTAAFGWLLHRSWWQQAAVTDALRRSEQLFRSVFENSMLGMATTSPEKGWLTVNQRLCDILGYDRDELQRMSWSDVTHPDDLVADVAFFERVLAGEIDAYEMDKRYIRKDGEVIDAYIAPRAIRRPDGSIDYFIALVQDITARKRTEARLRASEAELSAAVDHAAAGIAFVAPDGRWLRVNERLCEIVAYSQDELLSLTFQDITHPDDLEVDLAQLARVLRREIDSYSLDKRYIRKDGRCIWIHLGVSLIFNDDGTPNHFVSVIEDIDARKNAERESRRLRELMRDFLDHLPGLAFIKDPELRFLHANRGLQAQLQLEESQILGRRNGDVFPGALSETLGAFDQRVLASGETEVMELAYGPQIYQTTKFLIRQDDGPALLGGIALDVTRRYRLEQRTRALLEINERSGVLPEREFLAYGLEIAERLTASEIGFLHFVNDDQETIELCTWTAGALKGCSAPFDRHYPISGAGIWADCCREKRAVRFNDYAGHAGKRGLPEGHAVLQRLVSVPVIEQDAVRMIVGVGNKAVDYDDFDVETVQLVSNDIWNIVRRARAEAALARRLREVTELKDKLENAQLQLVQSEKMSAIGQLAAGVAHELNNPIGFVYSNLGTLGEYVDELLAIDAAYSRIEEARPGMAAENGLALGNALAEVHRLKAAGDHAYLVEDLPKLIRESKEGLERVRKIVLDLRDFSRVGESEWQWADLEKGLDSTINIVWNELKYKADVERQYASLPPIRCLASQLNQVFMNLLVNAAQAIETRGRIIIRTGTDTAADATIDALWVEIEDSGRGMSPEVQKRLFEPFFTTKQIGQGTGLGLSISYGIVQKHHGRIDFRSAPGRGTVFRISLPIDATLGGVATA